MSENCDMNKAREVFATITDALDRLNWHYTQDSEKMIIKSGIAGDDLPIEFLIVVNAESQCVQLLSRLPFHMPDDMRVDGAIAVAVANYGLTNGSFDYDISDGEVRFRLTTAYHGSTLGGPHVEYMIACTAKTVDEYNDRFFMLAKKLITIEKFIELENGD